MLGAVIIFVSCFGITISIPLRDFFAFGSSLDSRLPGNDDNSTPAINLSVTFPYFDKNYRVVYVSYIAICIRIALLNLFSLAKSHNWHGDKVALHAY